MGRSVDVREVRSSANRRTIDRVRFCVLGTLEVVGGDGPIALGSPKQRRLMAALICRVGEAVSADALVDAVWEDGPPRSAAKTLQGYVVHLRQAMAASANDARDAAAIVTAAGGYRLDAAVDAVDAVRFTSLVTRGRQAAALRDWTSAQVFVTEALALWRGPAYVEFDSSEFAAAEAARLEELRLVATETRFEIDLALGEDAALVPDLEKVLALQPTRERLWELLIRALYRAGRQSDALLAFVRARRVLAEELGVDPGRQLRAAHAAVLAQDPALDRVWSGPVGLSARQPTSGVYAFDGREPDLSWLRSLWLATHEQGGRSAVICGSSGMGKTRLLGAFADEVQRSGAVVVRRTGLTAPNLATVVAVAGGGPALVVLDDPLTGVDLRAPSGSPVLVVAGIDRHAAPGHVVAAFAAAQWRELAPLPDEVGSRIAQRWLGQDRQGVDVKAILTAAAGNPGQLHRLLAEAVELRSRQRIDASVAQLRTAHADLAASRARVAHGVRGLRRGRALVAAMPGTAHTGGISAGCPYRGLEPYELGDAELFHGRDAVVERLVARVADTALVAVVGASGSGKSSVVQAGLLPALSAGCLPGSASWPQFVVTPADPLPAPQSLPAVVVVDQFEQAWVAHDDTARPRYLEALVALADAGCRVVLTLRADHVDRCSQHARLRDLIGDGTVLLGPLNAAEMTEVIIGPAELSGHEVEPALVARLLDDVRGLTAPLPLVSTALAATWEQAVAGTLTREGYLRCGGVAGALARRAEAAYAALTPEEQGAARHVLLRLATGEPGMLVRRRCPYPEAASSRSARRAVDALAAARLITVDAAVVEVAHEVLFDNWPRLTNWLEEDEQGRRLRAHLAPAALDWSQSGRAAADLYRGVRLDAAVALAADQVTDLTPIEKDFLAASLARAEQELQAERARAAREARAGRRLRGLLTAVAATAALAVAATVIAVGQRNSANDNARVAVARQLGAAALIDQPLDHSLLLAASAVKIDNNVSTRGDLLAALQRAPAAQSVWHGDGSPIYQLALTDHDQTAIGAGFDSVSMWNLTGPRTATTTGPFGFRPQLATRPGTDQVAMANLSPDDFTIELRDPRNHHEVGRLLGATARTTSLAWTPDGRWLAVAQQTGDVLVWDVDSVRPPLHIARYRPVDIQGSYAPEGFPIVAYAGGSRFAVIETTGDAEIRSPGSPRPMRTFSVGADVLSVSTNPRGTMLAVGHNSGAVTLSSLADGRPLQALTGHSAAVRGLEFSRDGRLFASIGDDKTANVTDLVTRQLLGRFTGHTEPGSDLAFTRDNHTLYTTSTDGKLIGWDLANLNNLGAQLSRPVSGPERFPSMAVSPTGEIAMEYPDGTLRIWPPDDASPPRAIRSGHVFIGIAFSPDGHLLATSDSDGIAGLVDVRSQRMIATVAELPAPAHALAFSPDGRRIVWITDNGRAYYFDSTSRRSLGHPHPVIPDSLHVIWSPDSRNIALTGAPGSSLVVYDVSTGIMRWEHDNTWAGAWSPDGATIAAAGDARTGVQLLRASDGAVVGGGWKDHPETVALAYSPDGSILTSTGRDATVVLRDLATGDRIGPALTTASTQEPATVAFDAAGHLVVQKADGGLWRWNISLPYLLRTACATAGRNLTIQEWAALHTGRPFLAACRD